MKDFFVLFNIREMVQKIIGEQNKIIEFRFIRDYNYKVVADFGQNYHVYTYNYWDRELLSKESIPKYNYRGY